ncbi:MAG: hypothetical protein EA422_02200 [Gemmatimonadales bacterium]|nr:MAG: hypothetical protein EA422_02200 [Gemmatimonadales bacterium]
MIALLLSLTLCAAPAVEAPDTGAPPDPCTEPLGWRVAEVDPRFGLDAAEAEAAVQAAARLWNEAAGQELFVHDPDDGFDIVFHWDERHARIQDWLPRRRALDAEVEALGRDRAGLEELRADLNLFQVEHERRLETLDRRWDAHAERLAHWEERRPIPADVQRQLDSEAEELERERQSLNRDAQRLNDQVALVNRETAALNHRIEALNRSRAEVERDSPLGSIRSGFYRETHRTLGRWSLSVTREIFIYQFDDLPHLEKILAHELGHALGLEHTDEPGSLMHELHVTGPGVSLEEAQLRLTAADLALLREACPDLPAFR